MQRHNPILNRETVLRSLSKAGRVNQKFTPILAFDMPFDEYRIPLGTSQFRADRPFSHSPCDAPAGLDGRSLTITKD